MSTKYRLQTVTCTVTVSNGQTTGNSTDLPSILNGLVRAIYINAPTITGASYSVAINGPASGMQLFTKATLTPNAKTNILADANNQLLQIPVEGACGVSITSASSEGADRVFTIKLVIDRG